jgi:putative flippase GtrA
MKSLFRFGVVGIANNVTIYLLFLLLLKGFGVSPLVAMTVSFVTGVLTSYLLNRSWTFEHAGSRAAFQRYVALYVAAYVVNWMLLSAALHYGLSAALSQLAIIAIIASSTYVLQRIWVFGPSAGQSGSR